MMIFFFCFEIICVNEEVAKNCIETINLETLPKLNYFPYYISFSKLVGISNFLELIIKLLFVYQENQIF
jgi:hypothetical protein